MNLIDIIIIIWLVVAVSRGYAVGIIRQALSFIGFFLGLVIAGWAVPQVLGQFDQPSRILIALAVILVISAVFAGIGEAVGLRLQSKLKLKLAHRINAVLGSVVGAVFVLLSSWLIATTASRLPLANVSLSFEQSTIVRALTNLMPAAPTITDQLSQLLTPYGFPDVFVGPEPTLDPAGPPVTPEVNAAAAAASGSTVRVEGFACGGISTGSGYVAAPQYVVTNAHVVAGVRNPIIMNQGQRVAGSVVWFDPALDLAVVRTNWPLPGTPLALDESPSRRGTSVAVLGYPGGGTLTVSPGVVLRSQLALGRDIYGGSLSSREIYAIQAEVAPGNSGGPVVTAEGRVAGVIFGETATQNGIAYALTAPAIAESLETALGRTAAVNSGRCM